LDPSYFTPMASADVNPFNDIVVSIEALNNDPQIQIPASLSYNVTVDPNRKNVLVIQIQGWEN
jgi:hypothetical protein